MNKLLLTVNEAAEVLGVSRCGIYRLINSGELDSIKVGNRRRIPTKATQDYVDRKVSEYHEQIA